MKIKFEGFRGFDKSTESIDLNDITLLTGKNSSGKSTFIKLLLLFRQSFTKANSILDLLNLEINLASDVIGGRKNLLRDSDYIPKLIFECQFEFYLAYHEVHLYFSLSEYSMSISRIELYDDNKREPILTINGSPLGRTDLSISECNIFTALKRYKQYAHIHNILEMNLYSKYIDSYKDPKVNSHLFDDILQLPINKSIISNYEKIHFGSGHTYSVLDDILDFDNSNEHDQPFKSTYINEEYNDFRLLSSPKEGFISVTKSELMKLFYADSDLKNKYDFYVNKFSGLSDDVDVIDLCLSFTNNIYRKHTYHTTKLDLPFKLYYSSILDSGIEKITKLTTELDIDIELFHILLFRYEPVVANLLRANSKIYESGIVRSLRKIADITSIDNVLRDESQTFNIFNRSNLISKFISDFVIQSEDVQNIQLAFINKYIRLFDIGSKIKIDVISNIATVKLYNGEQHINLIDNGTGIHKLLRIILFLASNLSPLNSDELKDIIIIQEPESNLHPKFQSQLALMFYDYTLNCNYLLIIETHSEYMIRKFQSLAIQTRSITDKLEIYYFEMQSNEIISIKRISLENNGELSDNFKEGLLDVTNSIVNDLFILQNSEN